MQSLTPGFPWSCVAPARALCSQPPCSRKVWNVAFMLTPRLSRWDAGRAEQHTTATLDCAPGLEPDFLDLDRVLAAVITLQADERMSERKSGCVTMWRSKHCVDAQKLHCRDRCPLSSLHAFPGTLAVLPGTSTGSQRDQLPFAQWLCLETAQVHVWGTSSLQPPTSPCRLTRPGQLRPGGAHGLVQKPREEATAALSVLRRSTCRFQIKHRICFLWGGDLSRLLLLRTSYPSRRCNVPADESRRLLYSCQICRCGSPDPCK